MREQSLEIAPHVERATKKLREKLATDNYEAKAKLVTPQQHANALLRFGKACKELVDIGIIPSMLYSLHESFNRPGEIDAISVALNDPRNVDTAKYIQLSNDLHQEAMTRAGIRAAAETIDTMMGGGTTGTIDQGTVDSAMKSLAHYLIQGLGNQEREGDEWKQ